MKLALDIIVITLFVLILIYILRGFNKQQIQKHEDLLEKAKKRREELEND